MLGENSTISTKRLFTTAGKEAYGDENILNGVSVYIEQLNAEAAAMYTGEDVFNVYKLFGDGLLDLIIGDQVTDEDAITFVVKGVQSFKGGDVPSHTEAILMKRRQYA